MKNSESYAKNIMFYIYPQIDLEDVEDSKKIYFSDKIKLTNLISLNFLYDRVVRGGIIVLDEYACHKWTESKAVDKFLESHKDLQLKTLTWSRTPTAYFIKN